MSKMDDRYQVGVQCGRGHKGTLDDWGRDCRQCLRDRIKELENELKQIMEGNAWVLLRAYQGEYDAGVDSFEIYGPFKGGKETSEYAKNVSKELHGCWSPMELKK